MGKDASNIDLSRYTEGNPTLPGIYDVSVYVNDLTHHEPKHCFCCY
ncbi:FimD/PapC N-terminal domain-containing protein [Escherichia coli]